MSLTFSLYAYACLFSCKRSCRHCFADLLAPIFFSFNGGFGITPGGVGGGGGGQGPQGDGGVGTSDAGEDRLYSVSFHNKNTT